MAYTATSSGRGFSVAASLSKFVAQVRKSFALRAEYSRTYSELQGLTDRELNDIGVRRCDIKDIARDHTFCS
ncbi:DUF1127 domain-containing protein [Ruegeria profundi]|uniref:YjiS-like domain-containing protein n=1 Tax=Ruegeria profundi TaxID=1685378 RepID=A0A0X3TQI9_9RHOB|nr:DUF1127 domain-containing protein [Ruegeria profundi]KUJ76706.1 hypothetical protein AVO44_19240 [Ruegeria profundi]MCA0930626.1 DUF1127 domain-containing protein [Ruegeria profundi]